MSYLDNISTLLFDFDNTLVMLDENDFVLKYGVKLAERFSDIFEPQEFLQHLMKGSYHMVTKPGVENNVKKFFDYFSKYCKGLQYNEVYDRFYEFYEEDFKVIKSVSKPDPIIQELFELVSNHFEIVIATNPLFPENAMLKRLEWVNLLKYWQNKSISLITHAELFSTAKPKPEYYLEILEHIKKSPETCLMIGNDYYNDGSASLVGMKFYHVNPENQPHHETSDLLSEQTKAQIDTSKIKITETGSLMDFYNQVKSFVLTSQE